MGVFISVSHSVSHSVSNGVRQKRLREYDSMVMFTSVPCFCLYMVPRASEL